MCTKKTILSILACLYIFIPLHSQDSPLALTVAENQHAYTNALQEAFTQIHIETGSNSYALRNFENGKNISARETEAIPLVNTNPNYTFTPHYVQTVVIAIDREQTSEHITSWNDLLKCNLPINFSFGNNIGKMTWNTPKNYHIVTSMSKALYGSYNIKAIAKDFRMLFDENRFFSNDDTLPISVMHDSEAVQLIKEGRNIEIVFPSEGTQSFVAGILHKKDAIFSSEKLNEALIQKDLRLLDGTANSFYPNAEQYANASITKDFTEYNKAIATVDSIMRRDSFKVKRYGLANRKEQTFAYIFCIIILVFYITSIIFRVTQKNIRIILMCIFLLDLLLATTQFLKALVGTMPNLETFLWYAFYFPFVMMPVLFVYIAIMTGKNNESFIAPIQYKIYFVLSCIPILFVATNNIHEQVFDVYDYIHTYFYYNWGYYFVMCWIYVSLFFALVVLLYKSFKIPRKWAFLLPLMVATLTLLYTIGVVLRIPIARDFDVGYGTGIMLILFTEACIQSRLFPVNKGYRKLFAHSSLQMEIRDIKNSIMLRSSEKKEITNNHVLRHSLIHGGTFLFYEDFTALNKTKEKLKSNIEQLEINNSLLEKSSTIEAELAALSVQKEVYKNIDNILEDDTNKIAMLLESMQNTEDSQRIVANINCIVCGTKRECILRINTMYNKPQTVYEFLTYIHEMSEYTASLPLKITIGSYVDKNISPTHTLLMYEVFRSIIEGACTFECESILAQIYENNGELVFSLITNKDISNHIDLNVFQKKAHNLHGNLITKPWDNTTAFLLSFNIDGETV